jgi:hypothetical protein
LILYWLSFHLNLIITMKVISKGLFRSIREFRFLEKRLGNGSFGVVRLAVHRATGRLYAVKVVALPPRRSTSRMCRRTRSCGWWSGKSACTPRCATRTRSRCGTR